jgi:C2 domain
VSKKTLNPVYPPKDSTFDFPIYLSLADKLGVLELVLWDKDVLKKEYLGEAGLPLEDWFREGDNGLLFDWNDALVREVDIFLYLSPHLILIHRLSMFLWCPRAQRQMLEVVSK